jgi:hypothetical protein
MSVKRTRHITGCGVVAAWGGLRARVSTQQRDDDRKHQECRCERQAEVEEKGGPGLAVSGF